jgi:hypothetical protein
VAAGAGRAVGRIMLVVMVGMLWAGCHNHLNVRLVVHAVIGLHK